MKKILLSLAFIITASLMNAQDTSIATDSLEGWSSDGKITLLINQSAFSNWQPGGDNNAAANLSINYNIDYVKGLGYRIIKF